MGDEFSWNVEEASGLAGSRRKVENVGYGVAMGVVRAWEGETIAAGMRSRLD